ncbi:MULTISPECIES: HemK/PrmC family methyltransferase [unclassified Faecalibacterium]|jgi:release factor glutamine methyltransferase|uniref:N5-glutamine methyltransferase family protein n=1 Tax=unclassified Faecalibacterium TaxID=2646395 RepID=UPI000E751642|nr:MULTISPECIES: HemK/PrmC family methyltransferase [unclassified Faecalibacterium]RJV96562.1 peptide chain release factor N(5)-glutamine methyltransferase [Faecalibacterium sp. AM43-5AT]RJW76977.1 peptide chain release factor N(5)-glutamine methyltransferase [Faecalibacterium sp. AF10-46]
MVIAGLTPREAVRAVEARLSAAGCPDADYDARELFRVAAGRDARLSDRVLTTEEAEKLEALCTRREQREPLQYLCGIWSFLDFDLAVGPGVLCPRADTEVVAEAAANTLTGIAAPRVLDLCAGTGCLGLGVKRFCPAAQVTCVEKSPEAFVYLEKNCRCALKGQGGQTEDLLEPTAFEQADAPAFDWGPALNALRAKAKQAYAVQPVEGDLFTYWQGLPEGQLDLIVSNPPYLTAEEMRHLQPEVAQEPAMALEAGKDGLMFYRALAEHYQNALRPGGALVLEIGWQQRQAVAALLAANGWADIECRKDFGGNDRCMIAHRPEK